MTLSVTLRLFKGVGIIAAVDALERVSNFGSEASMFSLLSVISSNSLSAP